MLVVIKKKDLKNLVEFEDKEEEAEKEAVYRALSNLETGKKYFLSADLWPWRTSPTMNFRYTKRARRPIKHFIDQNTYQIHDEYLNCRFAKLNGKYGYVFEWIE